MLYKDQTVQINLDNLDQLQIGNLKQVMKAGEAHLKYFEDTMKHFKFPERRMKTDDTIYYEKVLPIVRRKIRELETTNL
jgi:hypothetical protein